MRKYFSSSSFVAGTMLGMLVSAVWFAGDISDYLPASASFSASTSTPDRADAMQSSKAISVRAQAAGNTVLVDSVTVPPPGVWVAVREVNGSDLGNVLGAARIGNSRTEIIVPLLRATESDRVYAVQLYRNDANSEFDPATSSVYIDFDSGMRVVAYFSTNL